MTLPFVTIWGYGADIRATKDSLTIRQNGKVTKHSLDDINHLLIAGGHTFHTASMTHLLAKNIPISFFDAHGNPSGRIFVPGKNSYHLETAQKHATSHKFSMAVITASLKSRMLFLNELAEKDSEGLYLQGEFEILTEAANELGFLVTLQEIGRVFTLSKNMYYEILSRAVPRELGYHRMVKPPYMDPINAMFAHGYAVLYANFSVAVEGAGLNPSIGVLPEIAQTRSCGGSLVFDLMEAAKTSMVDRVVIGMIREGLPTDSYETDLQCVLSDELMQEFSKRLSISIDDQRVSENVAGYADALENNSECVLRF